MYNPPADLDSFELGVIGQALVSDVSNQVRQLSSMAEHVIPYCAKHGWDAEEVFQRELSYIHNRYAVVQRFVVSPLPWEMFVAIARKGWAE